MLEHKIDTYNGVIISSKSLPDDELLFGRELETSLKQWIHEGRKGIWLRIPAEKASLIPIAISVTLTRYISFVSLRFVFSIIEVRIDSLLEWNPKKFP